MAEPVPFSLPGQACVAGLPNQGNSCFFNSALQVGGVLRAFQVADLRRRSFPRSRTSYDLLRNPCRLQALASSSLVLEYLEAAGQVEAAAPQRAATAQHSPAAAATWASALRWLAGAGSSTSGPGVPPAPAAPLTCALLPVLRGLQPSAAPLPRVDPSRVRRALALHLPHGNLAWGEQHDASEALEVRGGARIGAGACSHASHGQGLHASAWRHTRSCLLCACAGAVPGAGR